MPKILCLRLANGEEKRAREIWRTFAADSQFDNNDNKSKSPWRAACEWRPRIAFIFHKDGIRTRLKEWVEAERLVGWILEAKLT